MTEEQYEFLKQFENNFITSINFDYSINIQQKNLLKIKEIYEQIIGSKYIMCTHCTTDVLNLLKKIGKKYFEYKNKEQEVIEPQLKINDLKKVVTKKERKNNKIKNN
jgi:hypothetical protein